MATQISPVIPVFPMPVGPGAPVSSSGGSGIVLSVSAPALQVSATTGGFVSDFSLAVGQAFMFNGSANVNAQTTFSITVQNNCTAAITTGGAYSFSALSQNVGSIVIQAIYLGVTYSITVTISKQIPGSTGPTGATGPAGPIGPGGLSGLTLVLSNPAATVLAYANGNVPSFAGISGQATVLSGGTDVTASSVFSAVSANLTGTVNSALNTPVTGAMGFYQVTAMSATIGTLTITAQYLGTNVTQVFNVTQVPTGYQIVSSLPSSGPALFQGNVIFNTADNKLYRYTGTAWTAVVPATDVTGQLTAAQIASINSTQIAGTLTAAQIASIASTQITGQLTNVQIASLDASQLTGFIQASQIAVGSITTNQIAAGTIVAGNIAAGAITTPAISAGAVTATQIASGTIVAGNIAAGTITGTQIAAGTITSSNILTNTITANQIAAGTITAAKMGVSSLSSMTANLGSITAGTISALSGQALIDMNNGFIEWNNGVYMKVSGVGFGVSSNYIEWFGPTQSSATNFAACTDALGVYWIKLDGTYKFGTSQQAPATTIYTGTTGPFTATVTVPSGKTTMTAELWGDSGASGAGNVTVPTQGGAGASGSYSRSVYNISAQAGNTLLLTLYGGASSATSSIVAGTMTGFTTMDAFTGANGTAATSGADGLGGVAAAAATGGNVVNLPGNNGGNGAGLTGAPTGPGSAVPGLYGQGNPGGIGKLNSTVNPGKPAIAAITFT